MLKERKVPEGYKMTEVGEIPEDWEVKEFNDVFVKKSTNNFQITSSEYLDGGHYPVVDQGKKRIVSYSNAQEKVFYVDIDGVIIFGDHTRIFKFIDFDFVLGADGTQVLSTNSNNDTTFQFYQLLSKEIPNTGYNRHFKYLKEFLYFVPSLSEQKAIAEVLTDTDNLIQSIEKLIDKKRKIKQGAMQQPLTGKKRLLGFSGEWEEEKVKNIGCAYGGLSGKSKTDFEDGNKLYITFLNVINNTKIQIEDLKQVQVKDSESQNRVNLGDLLFNTSSETPDEVGMCAVLLDKVDELYLNSFCFGFRIYDQKLFDSLYLAYFFRSDEGRKLFYSLAQGATRYNLSKKLFYDIEFSCPEIQEQKAIAQVLSDMDSEIEALEEKLEKYKKIKQGMMQELLTGRIRLI